MQQQKRKGLTPQRLVINAMLAAIYIVLRYFNIPVGNFFRITVAPFAVILCAMLYGPADALIVGFLGEFISQITGPYGLTQTTLLWCVGETVRGGTLGLLIWIFLRGWLRGSEKLTGKQTVFLLCLCSLTGILAALGQTLALYVDSKLFGYYTYVMVFGVMIWRIVVYVVLSGLMGYLCLPIIAALRKAKLVK